jgi:ubiquinone/menaquinone biosynthesis C-methylase UbiE
MMMNHKENSVQFWDGYFKDSKPLQIDPKEVKVEHAFDAYLKQIGDTCQNVLDVGCGMGTSLMGAKCLGHIMEKGVGFDASKHAIYFAEQTTQLSGITGLSFYQADESFLKTIEDASFDGMICSNFLDVIIKELSDGIISEMKRILKPKGLLLLKLNFFLDASLIEKLKMELIDENTYQINGVIRSYNLPTEAWIQRFEGFEVMAIDGFQRAPHLPKDRILLLKKM